VSEIKIYAVVLPKVYSLARDIRKLRAVRFKMNSSSEDPSAETTELEDCPSDMLTANRTDCN
jgi:hypothetical protein